MEQSNLIIEQLVRDNKLEEALAALSDFFKSCNDYKDDLILSQRRLANIQKAFQQATVGYEADLERNRIALGFLSLLDEFRRDTLRKYFDIADKEAFFEGMTSRDAVIHEILDTRLRPKRYIRETQLLEGNSSIIYRLLNADTGRHAIAMVLKAPELHHDIFDEVDRLTEIRHRNIIKLLDHELTKFPFFVVTEYIYGENLQNSIDIVGPRPEAQAIDWLYQLTDALDYLRHKRILHTNIRPSKIYIDDEWQVMISPFDLNKAGTGELTYRRYRDMCQYGAPELLARDGAGLEQKEMIIADQYSLGLIAYKVLTGKDLFDGIMVHDILESRNKFVRQKQFREEKLSVLPQNDAGQIIRQLLEEDPAARFPSLHKVLRALHPLTRHDQPDLSVARRSYRRCLASNKTFIRDFYKDLYKNLPEVEQHFNALGKKRQSAMLQMAVDILLDAEEKKELLLKLVNNKVHAQFNVGQFEVFMDTLLASVEQNDPIFTHDVLLEWQAVKAKTLSIIHQKA